MDDADACPPSPTRLLTPEDHHKVGTALANRRARKGARSGPLPLQPHQHAAQTDQQRRAALLQCLEHLGTLPAASAYARHRRRVVTKALQLLDMCVGATHEQLCDVGNVAHAQGARHASTQTVPVAVVGAGPTGLTMSLLLSRLRVAHVVLERRSALPTHPQAHFINYRTMEIFRSLGSGLYEQILAQSPPLEEWRRFVYCETVTGQPLGVVDHFPGQSQPAQPDVTPAHLAHLSQHRLLPLLNAAAQEAAARAGIPPPLRLGHAVRELVQLPSHVGLSVDAAGGEAYTLEASYVVAADGANSSLRSMLKIPMTGQEALQHLVNVHFTSPDLAACMQRAPGQPAMLHFVFNQQVIAAIVTHNLQEGEFVAQLPYFPPLQSVDDFSPSRCRVLLEAAAGAGPLKIDIHSVRTWTMHAQVAARFQDRRVLLAGDAAHRFPPAGGFGMNSGIQDAHNLAWKLASVLAGSRPALLHSYHAERKPVAHDITTLSVRNWEQATRVPAALGLSTAAAGAVQTLASTAAGVLPRAVAKRALESLLSLGQGSAGLRGPLAPWRRSTLESIFAKGDSLRLQFVKEDLGTAYCATGGAAVVACPSAAHHTQPKAASQSVYEPSTAPGSRLPHLPVIAMHVATQWAPLLPRAHGRCSLLDLVPYGALEPSSAAPQPPCTLIASAGAATGALAALPNLHVVVVAATRGEGAPGKWGNDVSVVVDVHGAWPRLLRGAVLVRPDGHVGWRGEVVSEAAVQQALCALLQPASPM